MQVMTKSTWKNVHFAGRVFVGCLALLGASRVTDSLLRWFVGYDEVVDAVVVISTVSLVWVYLLAPAIAEIYPREN